MYKEIELEKKAIHHSFSAFSSKPCNSQNQPSPCSNPVKIDTGIKWDSTRITYTGAEQPIDVSIGQAHYRGACYLYDKTRHFTYKCSNQKTQIRTIFYIITSEKRQMQVDKMRELDKSSAEEKQPAKKALLKENFTKAQE